MAAVITNLTTGSGTTLLNGLSKDAPLDFSVYLPSRMALLMIAPRAWRSVPRLFDQRMAGPLLLRKWRLSYSFFRETQSHFLPPLSGRSPVNCLSECGRRAQSHLCSPVTPFAQFAKPMTAT